jgi:endonuclease
MVLGTLRKIKSTTVNMHIEGMSVNNPTRKYHPNIKPGSGHDLFYKLGPNQFRLWVPDTDPAPRYREDFEKTEWRG